MTKEDLYAVISTYAYVHIGVGEMSFFRPSESGPDRPGSVTLSIDDMNQADPMIAEAIHLLRYRGSAPGNIMHHLRTSLARRDAVYFLVKTSDAAGIAIEDIVDIDSKYISFEHKSVMLLCRNVNEVVFLSDGSLIHTGAAFHMQTVTFAWLEEHFPGAINKLAIGISLDLNATSLRDLIMLSSVSSTLDAPLATATLV